MIKAKYITTDGLKRPCEILEDLGEKVKIKTFAGNIYTVNKNIIRDVEEGLTIWSFLGLGIIAFVLFQVWLAFYFNIYLRFFDL